MENRAEPAQLALFCGCGRRPVELREPGCCRLCYCRRYRSLRFFGGLREVVLKRDRFRCRACGLTVNADVNAARNIAAGHAVTARGGHRVAGPANREPQLALLSA